MAVAAELAQERARVPEREAGLVGPLLRHRPRQRADGLGSQPSVRCVASVAASRVGRVAEQTSERGVDRIEAGGQRWLRGWRTSMRRGWRGRPCPARS